MKKTLIAILFSLILAIESANESNSIRRQPAPIIYYTNLLPRYGRKRPLRYHFEPQLSLK